MRIAVWVLLTFICIFSFANPTYAMSPDENLLFRQTYLGVPQTNNGIYTLKFDLFKSGSYKLIIPKTFKLENFIDQNNNIFYSFNEQANQLSFLRQNDSVSGESYTLILKSSEVITNGSYSILLFNQDLDRYFVMDFEVGNAQTRQNFNNNLIIFSILLVGFAFFAYKILTRNKSLEVIDLPQIIPAYKVTYRSPKILGILFIFGFVFALHSKANAADSIFVSQQTNPVYSDSFAISFSGILNNEDGIKYFCEIKSSDKHFERIFLSSKIKTKIVNEACNFSQENFNINGYYDVRIGIITSNETFYSEAQTIYFERPNSVTTFVNDKITPLRNFAFDFKWNDDYSATLLWIGIILTLVLGISFAYIKIREYRANEFKLPQIN